MDLIGERREFSFFNKKVYNKMMTLIKEGGDDFVSSTIGAISRFNGILDQLMDMTKS
jgi:hypothetical protein